MGPTRLIAPHAFMGSNRQILAVAEVGAVRALPEAARWICQPVHQRVLGVERLSALFRGFESYHDVVSQITSTRVAHLSLNQIVLPLHAIAGVFVA